MKTCPFCKEPLQEAATTCPACAEPLPATHSPDAPPPILPQPGPGGAANSQNPSRVWRILLWAFGSVLSLGTLTGTLAVLKENRLWPFATGTTSPAFLGTTFGMSPQEVARVLKKEGTQLLSHEEFKRVDTLHQIDLFDFLYASKEEGKMYSDLCMPSITMFETEAEAKFTFCRQRLESVTVYFGCYGVTNTLNLVESIKSHLLTASYTYLNREDSPYLLWAFTLNYTSTNSSASLWVNLADTNKLIVNLTLIDFKSQAERKKQLKEREKKAFGPVQ